MEVEEGKDLSVLLALSMKKTHENYRQNIKILRIMNEKRN